MNVGIRLPEGKDRFDDAVEFASLAEELGYDSVWLGEHHLYEGPYWPSPHVALAGISQHLDAVDVGTNILQLPLANPVRLAGELSVLSQMGPGRILLGVSTGYRMEEYEALGVPPARRGRRMVEYVAAMRELWDTEGASFDGSYVQFEDATLSPRPTSPLEFWIGGYADGALDAVAQVGDGWIPGATPTFDELETHRRRLTDRLADRSRELSTWPLARQVFVDTDPQRAMETARTYAKTKYANIEAQGYDDVLGQAESLEEFIDARMIVGTPAECLEQIEWLREAFGTTHLIVKMWHSEKSLNAFRRELELFADSVLPSLHSVGRGA